jgi:glycogen debranching enzyme
LEDIIQVENQFYVLATSSLADDRTRVLKHGETFAVFNRFGDIEDLGLGEQGLYHRGTRHLSRLTLRLCESLPQLLRSTLQEDDTFLTIDMMNLDVYVDGDLMIPRGSLHVFRSKFLWKGTCYETLRLCNFGLAVVETTISLQFGADYADIFQVRGAERPLTGMHLPPKIDETGVTLGYHGRDGESRSTRIEFAPAPASVGADTATYQIKLSPREEMTIVVAVACAHGDEHFSITASDQAMRNSIQEMEQIQSQFCSVSSSHVTFNRWISRSQSDVIMMIRGNPEGAYPYAGVPWFSTVFGRDALITAMECLWAAPWIAESVLKYLAQNQAVEIIPEQEAEPGKILHEVRRGEMANLGEVPFSRYYGSVDSTPLFVLLAGLHFERTGNKAFLQSIWPNVLAALDWVDRYGDADGDGFVEYRAKAEKGLIHQGWKDSHDSIFHADGSLADAPIALCEVQAYVYAAKLIAARMATSLGRLELSEKLTGEAHALQEKFERDFWDESLGTYVLALDARKKACRVLASNAGHCLWAGIASPERAEHVMTTLLGDLLFCGWGIRTVASNEVRYNPMSYHNGSVWPHDNALVAAGFSRYGYKKEAGKLLLSLLNVSAFMELSRLPELFCGFHKRPGVEGPTLYPVACSPQAWSAGAAYLLLHSCLGMAFVSDESKVRFTRPYLPGFIDQLTLRGLQVGSVLADLSIHRVADRVAIEVLNADSRVSIELED